jgi:hypothetical protein
MSEDEKGFLARWSQRKRDAGKAEAKPAVQDEPAPPAETKPEATAGETEPPIDLESLPKLEDLTASTDMTVFFKKGVPDSIRNAALRKSWALDPAVRNYVNPALDYAYDWNTPGGVPGGGELPPGTDVARMVAQIMGEPQPLREIVDKASNAETHGRSDAPEHVAGHQAAATPPAPSVRLSETSPHPAERRIDVASAETPAPDAGDAQDEQQAQPSAPQQETRRHGSARPK